MTRIGPEGKPKLTLGWQVLEWTADYLQHPDGKRAREPWRFTPEQARFILHWFAIDEDGVFLYDYGMLRRMKGWGKDPVGAVLCAVEFVGPCRFSHFSDNGDPVAKDVPAAWVQTAAVSRDQTRNTMTLFPGLFQPKAIERYGISLGKEIIYAENGARRIEAVTSSPTALEGQRSTFVLKNETHHWRANNDGHEMAAAIRRNVAKIDGRILAISNAHAPGEDSDAEHDLESWKIHPERTLYDSVEAPETDLQDDVAVREGLAIARGDSWWLNLDRFVAEIRDPRTTPAMARRFYLNQIVAEEDKPFDRQRWDDNAREGYLPERGAKITLGFDGSLTRDHTALIGTEIATGHQWVVGYWEPRVGRDGEVRIPFMEVDQAVDHAFDRWDVWRMNADPFKWGSFLDAWAGKYGGERVVRWSTTNRAKMAKALQDYRIAIETGALSHDNDPRFNAAIANSHKYMLTTRDDDNEFMWLIQKERPDSPLKIDAAVAACLSWEARAAAVADGVLDEAESSVMFV